MRDGAPSSHMFCPKLKAQSAPRLCKTELSGCRGAGQGCGAGLWVRAVGQGQPHIHGLQLATLTSSSDAGVRRISVRDPPGWHWMTSTSICLVLGTGGGEAPAPLHHRTSEGFLCRAPEPTSPPQRIPKAAAVGQPSAPPSPQQQAPAIALLAAHLRQRLPGEGEGDLHAAEL